MTIFSQELRKRRTKRNLSIRAVARHTGMANSLVQRFEKGIGLMEMSVSKALTLADFFRWDLRKMLRAIVAEVEQQKERK